MPRNYLGSVLSTIKSEVLEHVYFRFQLDNEEEATMAHLDFDAINAVLGNKKKLKGMKSVWVALDAARASLEAEEMKSFVKEKLAPLTEHGIEVDCEFSPWHLSPQRR